MKFKLTINPYLQGTPARVNINTGLCEYNPNFFTAINAPKEIKDDFLLMVICHEWAHYFSQTRDEKTADKIGFNKYLANGGSVSNALKTLKFFLTNDKNPEHKERIQHLYAIAKMQDKAYFYPYQHTHNLQNKNTRKNIMQKQRYMQRAKLLRAAKDALRTKNYKLAGENLARAIAEETNERYIAHLKNLQRTLSQLAKNANINFQGGLDEEDLEIVVGYVGETAEHFEAMTDIESEVLSFNGQADDFDTAITEAAKAHEWDLFTGLETETNENLADITQESVSFLGKKANPAKADKKAAKAAAKEQRQERRKSESEARVNLKNAKAQAKILEAESGVSAERKAQRAGFLKDVAGKYIETAGKIVGNVTGGLANTYLGTDIQPMGKTQAPATTETPENPITPTPVADEPKKGLPMWAWIVIAVVGVLILGGGTWFVIKKMKK